MVIPILVYEDIAAGHDYLVDAFGFEPVEVVRTDDGTVVHGEVRMGDSRVWLHAVTAEHQMETPKRLPASHGGLSVWVPDVDAHYEKAKAAGARIDRPPADQEYGLREYGAHPEGHRFWFATPL